MKRIILTLVTVFSMCCLVACGGETKDNVTTGNSEAVMSNEAENSTVTAETTAEPTKEPGSEVTDVAPTEEPVTEATPEPTEEPSVGYEGIDMESDLPGEEWIETFVGIIDEPKIVVYSDITGRKEIVEQDAIVIINPDEDVIAIYLPEGYVYGGKYAGMTYTDISYSKHSMSYFLDSKKTREKKYEMAGITFVHEGEEGNLYFEIESQ